MTCNRNGVYENNVIFLTSSNLNFLYFNKNLTLKKIMSNKAVEFLRVGSAYPDIITFLKEKSPRFRENIGKLVIY